MGSCYQLFLLAEKSKPNIFSGYFVTPAQKVLQGLDISVTHYEVAWKNFEPEFMSYCRFRISKPEADSLLDKITEISTFIILTGDLHSFRKIYNSQELFHWMHIENG